MKVVALGGGHGLAATLTALRRLPVDLTAIVTVADNGGSSGRLRKEFNFLPPGDLRMALAALCADSDWGQSWAEILQYRFTSEGELNGHALGNLLLTALWDRDENLVAGIARVGELLQIVGTVLPMALEPLDIEGRFHLDGVEELVRGQVQVALAKGEINALSLIPARPLATPEGLAAIADADFITLGPGSWFSSVMPHLLMPAQRDALIATKAKRIVIFNLAERAAAKEFAGHSVGDHIKFALEHAPGLRIDYALVDSGTEFDRAELERLMGELGGKLIVADLASDGAFLRHSSLKLAKSLQEIFHQA
jgi:uncharacterized cofD-like protein